MSISIAGVKISNTIKDDLKLSKNYEKFKVISRDTVLLIITLCKSNIFFTLYLLYLVPNQIISDSTVKCWGYCK